MEKVYEDYIINKKTKKVIVHRHGGDYCLAKVMDWCEEHKVPYTNVTPRCPKYAEKWEKSFAEDFGR